jgi:hypothetical protein
MKNLRNTLAVGLVLAVLGIPSGALIAQAEEPVSNDVPIYTQAQWDAKLREFAAYEDSVAKHKRIAQRRLNRLLADIERQCERDKP